MYAHRLSQRAAPRWYRPPKPKTLRAVTQALSYELDFTALGANDVPLSQSGVWTNNTQGTGGNAAMGTQTSMQVRLGNGGAGPRICCESDGPHENGTYPDSFAVVPGFSGNQRIEAWIYKAPGYAPAANHEMEIFAGFKCFAENNKRNFEILIAFSGYITFVWFDGGPATWHVIYSSEISSDATADNDKITVELNRVAKTLKCWHNGVLRAYTYWYELHDEINAAAQGVLNNLGDGAGLAGLRRPGDAVEGNYGFRKIKISSVLLDAG